MVLLLRQRMACYYRKQPLHQSLFMEFILAAHLTDLANICHHAKGLPAVRKVRVVAGAFVAVGFSLYVCVLYLHFFKPLPEQKYQRQAQRIAGSQYIIFEGRVL